MLNSVDKVKALVYLSNHWRNKAPTTEEQHAMTDLLKHVQQIADRINNGYALEADELDGYDYEYQEGDVLSGFDYISDALDFNYVLDSYGELIEVRILVAYGGPNIWVNINKDGTGEVVGSWWADKATQHIYSDEMGIFEAVKEIREC